ncbi:zinc ribbon domain-containing protein [Methanoplanus endosymbiosus]|uniref:Zinc ribbon domain-containing protein n=1 Tax=Methanoplanus endosymbiosus TaxID=33865 RepID=A0A9E7TLB8_9EURY|nr:zinc ribbon domain-containing protein [Methanoplanus endosymbiosus]UUX92161.1 zinc ribbon domain-containing protein [Methanoplanus endosymbiosus]
MAFCEHCGAEISEGAKFCKNCGMKVESGVSGIANDNSGAVTPSSPERVEKVIYVAETPKAYESVPQKVYEAPPVVNAPPQAAGVSPGGDLRNPLIAAVASFFFPGLGQTYAGEQKRGLLFIAGTLVIGYFLGMFMIIPMLWATYDAYKLSKMINSGEKEFIAPSVMNYVIFFALWIVMVILLGALDLLLYGNRYYYSDYDFTNPMASQPQF